MMPFESVLKRARRLIRGAPRGQAALEAFFSFLLMIGAFVIVWSIAVAIYNQSKLQTATQLSAQGALLVYDRETYRGHSVGPGYFAAFGRAIDVSESLFQTNACGMVPDQTSGETPIDCGDASSGDFKLEIQCAPDLDSTDALYSRRNCAAGGVNSARALRVQTSADAFQGITFLEPLSSDAHPEFSSIPISGRATAYAYYPTEGTP